MELKSVKGSGYPNNGHLGHKTLTGSSVQSEPNVWVLGKLSVRQVNDNANGGEYCVGLLGNPLTAQVCWKIHARPGSTELL